MPFEARDTSKADMPEFELDQGINGSMKKVRKNAEHLKENAQLFEVQTISLKNSRFYKEMKKLQNSVID